MKYFNVTTIVYALNRIVEGGVTHEHRTSSATSALLQNYFDVKKFLITPEQIQEITRRIPDYCVEKVTDVKTAVVHLYVEVKSIVAIADYEEILTQVAQTVGAAMEFNETTSVYVIILKATKIGFYIYHLRSELDELDVPNFLGMVPLNYKMSLSMLSDINYGEMSIHDHMRYLFSNPNIITNALDLQRLGVENTPNLTHPHIWDLLNEQQADHIHNLFQAMAEGNPNDHIK